MLKISWAQAAAWRVRRQHLEQRSPAGSMLDVTSRLCGVHAQVMSSAALTLWARVEDLDREAVHQALWHDRTLVKTWAMRGTLHLLPSAEMHLWHAALASSRRYLREAAWKNNFGITLNELDRLTEAIGTVLHNRIMTREELMAEVARAMGTSSSMATKIGENSWGTILKPAAFAGGLCFGPSVGQRVQFTHPQSWLTPSTEAVKVNANTVPATVALRFLSAYAPASYRDFARWNGSGMATARRWMNSLGEEVTEVHLEGSPAWILTASAHEFAEPPLQRSFRLLPGFDQYVITASPHAEHLMTQPLRALVYRPQGWVSPVLLVNGRMAGVWRHEMNGSRLEVSMQPFAAVPAWVRKAAKREAERLAAFLGSKLNFLWHEESQ